jgi:hypothetical protein
MEIRRGDFALYPFPPIITVHTVTKQDDTALSSIITGNFIMKEDNIFWSLILTQHVDGKGYFALTPIFADCAFG